MSDFNLLGVVIAYNPEDCFIDNISTYIDSLSELLVIENSKLDHAEKEKLNSLYPGKIVYKSLGGNSGISMPLNFALAYCGKNKYTHLLTMDQDSSFPPGAFNSFLDTSKLMFQLDHKVCLCAPSIPVNGVDLNKDNGGLFITSGNLINISRLGGISYDENIFIDGVDFDLCMSIQKSQLKTVKVANTIMNHNLGDSINYKLLNVNLISTNHSVFRLYYIFRNYSYLIFKSNSKGFRYKLVKLLVQFLFAIIFKEDDKIVRFKFAFTGLYDSFTKKMGRKY